MASIALPPLIRNSSIAVEVLLPVGRVDRCIGNRVSAVDHHAVADIDTDMAGSRCVVSSLEENQVTGLCLTGPDNGTVIHQTASRQAAHVPTISAVIDYP